MRARLAGSSASKSAQGGDNAALDEASIGLSPLARTAASTSERILLSVFGVSPAATGLMPASLPAIAARSSGRRAGSSPSSAATREIAERRSRRRGGGSNPLVASAPSTSAGDGPGVLGVDLLFSS